MRIVFIQFGDFLAATQYYEATNQETYHAQRYSMEIVERLAASEELACVICVSASENYAEVIESTKVSTYGMTLFPPNQPPRYDELFALLTSLRPTHVVLRFPNATIIKWFLDRNIRLHPSFADSFQVKRGVFSWASSRRMKALAALLNDPRIDIVGNHNFVASTDLANIGVDPGKIVPWDWPRSPTPDDFNAKRLSGDGPRRLLFVGAVSEGKGVGDIIRAFASDRALYDMAQLTVVGAGDIAEMQALAQQLGVDSKVNFLGRMPFKDVTPTMHEHDALLVYTRHAYAEGMPGVIYQGLSAHTPIVMSDHPMFLQYFSGVDDVVFAPEKNPDALAKAVRALLEDPARYARLSDNSGASFRKIAHNTYWVEVVERWLRDSDEDRQWLKDRALKNLLETRAANA